MTRLHPVSVYQALKLEELGFLWPTDASYYPAVFDGKEISYASSKLGFLEGQSNPPYIRKPTLALALKWLRDTHNLGIYIDKNDEGYYYLSETPAYIIQDQGDCGFHATYEKAEAAALDGAIAFLLRRKEKEQI